MTGSPNHKPCSIVYAVLNMGISISGQSELEVIAKLDTLCPQEQNYLVENNLNHNVIVARAVVQPAGHQTVLHLLNPNNKSIRLCKGMKLAKLEPLPNSSSASNHTDLSVKKRKQIYKYGVQICRLNLRETYYVLLVHAHKQQYGLSTATTANTGSSSNPGDSTTDDILQPLRSLKWKDLENVSQTRSSHHILVILLKEIDKLSKLCENTRF